jgi:hypothetical protein
MMNQTIFPVLSIDRARVHWEDFLETLTPVEKVGSMYFKRDDFFAPLGYGGINGAKVRQLTWLTLRYIEAAKKNASLGLLYAGSVRSPQIGRVPAVAKHFGLPSAIVLGSALQTAIRHENVAIAARFDAAFLKAPAPYNPSLQATAKKLLSEPAYRDYYQVEYGLSVEGSPERIESFYRFCSEQVRNLPDDVETLIVPAGSCNTTLSVLYGVARFKPKGLKRIVLIGVGPTRVDWYEARLALLGIGGLFERHYHHHPDLAKHYNHTACAPYELHHYDLFSTKWSAWDKESHGVGWGPIGLHPSYEAKVMEYLRKHPQAFGAWMKSGRACFWIVGSEPSIAAMEPNLERSDAL